MEYEWDEGKREANRIKCVAIFRETRRDIPISLGSEKLATAMPSAARDVLRPLRLALRAAPQLPQ